MREDGSIECWGNVETPPSGSFVQVEAGVAHACARRPDGTASCWPAGQFDDYGQLDLPEDENFIDIGAGWYHSCGLRADGSLLCVGIEGFTEDSSESDFGQVSMTPAGAYSYLDVGALVNCALDETGQATCWGDVDEAPPTESFSAIVGESSVTCGISSEGRIECWDCISEPEVDRCWNTSEALSTLDIGFDTCALRQQDESIVCAEGGDAGAPSTSQSPEGCAPPPGAWKNLSVGEIGCAVSKMGDISCWGWDDSRQTCDLMTPSDYYGG
jgi:hypothetical protein